MDLIILEEENITIITSITYYSDFFSLYVILVLLSVRGYLVVSMYIFLLINKSEVTIDYYY